MRQALRKLNNRLAALVMVFLLFLPTLPTVFAAEASGSCGDGVSWELSGGVLTISGSGAMADYTELTPAPWQPYRSSIRAVVVQEGVTTVGSCAFFKLDKLEAVSLPGSVKIVGEWAFYYCSALELVDLGGVVEIGKSAFERCLSLTAVRLPTTLQTLRYHAFYRCENLLSITIPASVVEMESSAFAYCINMRSAKVLANISELPLWTFYGCYELRSVSISSNITSIGTQAFYECDELTEAVYGGDSGQIEDQIPQTDNIVAYMEPSEEEVVEVTVSITEANEDGTTVTTEQSYTESEDSFVNTQITRYGDSVAAQIDAVLENADGWQDVSKQANDALKSSDSTAVNVWLKGDAALAGSDLGCFAGKDVALTIHTQQGAVWHINGMDLSADDLAKAYDLSFNLRPLTDPSKKQSAAVGGNQAFTVVFNKTIDFKVEVELPLGEELARQTAVFFAPEGGAYTRMQAVVIDGEGIAHFYLGEVQKKVEYLIGINVANPEAGDDAVSDAIIPDTMKNEYGNLEQVEEIEYVVTGVKSSLGITMSQLTWILVAVMGVSIIVVGGVLFAMNKRKLKNGYVPNLDEEDEKSAEIK